MASTLDRIANVSLIIASLSVTVLVGRHLASVTRAGSPGVAAYQTGDTVGLRGVRLSAAPRNLLMFVSSRCRFCADSLPFYARLSADEHHRAGRYHLVVVTPDRPQDIQPFLNGGGVLIDALVTSLRDPYVRGTPTLVLTDDQGHVIQSWIGELPPAAERKVLEGLVPGRTALKQTPY